MSARRIWLRLSRSREFAAGCIVLAALLVVAWHEFQRDGVPRLALLQTYFDSGASVDTAALCLRGLGVERDVLFVADFPVNDTQSYADSVVDVRSEKQFRRVAPAGARGYGPTTLHFNIFSGQDFNGDYTMMRNKLGRRAPFSRVHVPVPLRGCSARDAPGGNVDELPEPCDARAARAGRPGQGYVEIGSVTQALLATLPDRDALNMGDPYRSCAVVGSAPVAPEMRDRSSSLVDAADVVIRIGTPQAQEATQQLGRRTNIRVMGPADVAEFTAASNEHGTIEPWHKKGTVGAQRYILFMIITSETAMNATLRWKANNPMADVAIADADFLQWGLDSHGGTAPSAAYYALLVASKRCDRVLLFGMSDCAPAEIINPAQREEERITRVLIASNAEHFRYWTAASSTDETRKEEQLLELELIDP